jgi:YaiO family outer membrane protein
MKMKISLCMMILLFTARTSLAQEWRNLDVDDLFKLARETAFNGNRDEARQMLQQVLTKSPGYHEVRVFLARTYAWDKMYDQAIHELAIVLQAEPKNYDALDVSLDTEIWSEKYADGLTLANRALDEYPSSTDFLYKKASILDNLQKPDEAAVVLTRLLEIDPSHVKGTALMSDLKQQRMKHSVSLSTDFDNFSKIYSNAFSSSLGFSTTHTWGSSTLRLNYADRFSEKGVQPEIELYPRIADGVYAYLNYGYSESVLYPDHRVGAEIFTKLPKSFEASAGIRYLDFTSTSVVLYTGSIGYYFKNYWISVRPYLSGDDAGVSFSSTATLRLYFADSDNYLGWSFGYGFSPDDRRIQSSGGLSSDRIDILKSQRGGMTWQKTLPKNFAIRLAFNATYQELSEHLGNHVWITNSSIWVRKRF